MNRQSDLIRDECGVEPKYAFPRRKNGTPDFDPEVIQREKYAFCCALILFLVLLTGCIAFIWYLAR